MPPIIISRASVTRSATYLLLGGMVALLLASATDTVYRVQSSVADIAPLLPFGYAIVTDRSFGIAEAGRAMQFVNLGGTGFAFTFGVGYGVASLACTLPVFLAVVGASLTATSLPQAFSQFVSYALGMEPTKYSTFK